MTSAKPEAVSLSERLAVAIQDYADHQQLGITFADAASALDEVMEEVRSLERDKCDLDQRLARGVAGLVPEGWIVDGIGSHFLDDDSLEYTAELARRDEGGSCLEWVEGTGPTIEEAVRDAASRVEAAK